MLNPPYEQFAPVVRFPFLLNVPTYLQGTDIKKKNPKNITCVMSHTFCKPPLSNTSTYNDTLPHCLMYRDTVFSGV